MNTIHRTVWNRALGAWVAAPETARSRRKGGAIAKGAVVPVALATALWLGAAPAWSAGGTGGAPESTYYAGSGGSGGGGGTGGLNDLPGNASGGSGGSVTPTAVGSGGNASNGIYDGATEGTGGAAGVLPGENGAAGQSRAADGYGGGGGAGNHGSFSITSSDLLLGSPLAGGNGGAGGEGYWAAGGGGAGGYGASVQLMVTPAIAPAVTQQGSVTGGAGGKGGDSSSQAGGGGSGGAGISIDAGSSAFGFINSGTTTGGAGGAGGTESPGARYNAAGGGGGEGGAGVVLIGTPTVTNNGSISGGAGGAGGAAGSVPSPGGIGRPGGGGDGGIGLLIQANTATTVINNNGSISGGPGGTGGAHLDGGVAGANGAGGVGIRGANLSIANNGTISGGLNGDNTSAAAVQFTGGSNTLALGSGSVVNGRVEIGSGATGLIQAQAAGMSVDSLALGGAATLDATAGSSLQVSELVSGSGGLTVTGAGAVSLATANTYSGGTSVDGGNLRIASGQSLGSGATTIRGGGSLVGITDLNLNTGALRIEGTGTLGAAAGTTMHLGSPLVIASGANLVIGSAAATGVVDTSVPGQVDSPTSTLRVAGGTFTGSQVGFWTSSLASTTVDSGATLDFGGADSTVRNLQGAGKVQADAILSVGEGSFAGEISGNGTVTKTGAGTLTLSGNNSYGGGTALKQGRLDVGSNTALGTGELAMDDGTTLGFAADGLNIANDIRMTGSNDPVIDTGSFNETLSGVISGGGFLTKQGSGTLTLTGANNYTGATDVAAGTLRAGAAGTFSAASVHNVAAGATLDLAGFSQTVAGVSNAGTVSLVGSVPGTTLTVTGPWVGNNGTLRLGTTLGNSASASDRLVLSGAGASASGTTNVQITQLGGLGAQTTGNGIEVISAVNGATTTAQTTKDAFVLAGGHVDAGAFEYRLQAADAAGAGESWYLRSTAQPVPPTTPSSQAPSGPAAAPAEVPTYRVEVPLFAALPGQFREAGLAMVGNLHQRVGDEAKNAAGPRQAWGRIISMNRDMAQGGTVDPRSEGRLDGFQAGTDLWANPAWRTGVYVGQLDGDMDVNGFARGVRDYAAGSNDLRAQFVGAYATWSNGAGLYVDGVLQGGRLRYDVNPAAGAAASNGKGNSVLGSIEIGQAFAVAPGWVVEPQLQLIGQHVDLDDVTISGARIQQDTDDAWLLRAGVRVRGEMATSNGVVQPYARVNLYSGKGGTDIARFVGPAAFTDISTATGGTSVELAIGASWHLSPTVSVYGEVGNLWDIGGAVRTDGGINGSVGVKLRW